MYSDGVIYKLRSGCFFVSNKSTQPGLPGWVVKQPEVRPYSGVTFSA